MYVSDISETTPDFLKEIWDDFTYNALFDPTTTRGEAFAIRNHTTFPEDTLGMTVFAPYVLMWGENKDGETFAQVVHDPDLAQEASDEGFDVTLAVVKVVTVVSDLGVETEMFIVDSDAGQNYVNVINDVYESWVRSRNYDVHDAMLAGGYDPDQVKDAPAAPSATAVVLPDLPSAVQRPVLDI